MATPHSQATIEAAYDHLRAVALQARTATQKCLHEPFKNALATYSITSTQSLTNTIRAKLPRELRDMIYTHYWRSLCGTTTTSHNHTTSPDPDPIMLRRPRSWNTTCPARHTCTPCSCLSWETTPHMVLPAFVGRDMAIEVGIAAYKVFNSNAYTGPSPEDLRAYLEVDWWHLGLVPGDYYTSLHLYIHSNHVLRPPNPSPSLSRDKTPVPIFSPLGTRILARNFSALSRLKNQSRMRVKIQLDEMTLDEIEQLLELLAPIWRDLEGAGAKVEVWGDVPPRAFEALGPWRDLSGFYWMKRDVWRRGMGVFKR